MTNSRPIAGLFMAIFLIAAMAISFITLGQIRKEVVSLKLETALNGRWAIETEKIYDKNLPHYIFSTQSWGALNYRLFHTGKTGVITGDKGWLFTSEEFAGSGDPAPKIDLILKTRDQLKAHNIDLVVILLPAKARIYSENLGRYKLPGYKAPIYKETLNKLKAENIKTIDILSAFEATKNEVPLFLRTDTHWTPQGAQTAAQEVSKNLDLSYEKTNFKTEATGVVAHEGDLLRYVPAGQWQTLEPDQLQVVTTTETGAQDTSEDALFGDTSIPVTLVGTSYSANKLWNFEGFLKQELQTDILNAADEGLGPFETMDQYLKNEAFLNTPPQLVLWEIPERYLTMDPEKR